MLNFTQEEIKKMELKQAKRRLKSLSNVQIEYRLGVWQELLDTIAPQDRLDSLLSFLSISDDDFELAVSTSFPTKH